MHAGVAPIPASSGRTHRHRLARGGNRQLNATLHRIAITQIWITDSPGQLYYQRRRARGDSTMEAPPGPGRVQPPPTHHQPGNRSTSSRGLTEEHQHDRPMSPGRTRASCG